MPRLMREWARAKVNLCLHVTGRRTDGYHLLDSLVVFADAGDILSTEPADDLTLDVTGPFGGGLEGGPDNLVLRAARALADAAGVMPRARLVLDKRLPVASGIGGGSADAAAALRLLARLWRLDVAPGDLRRVAATLGADVPVCVASGPARMRGVGEVLDAVPTLPSFALLLVNPGVGVSTPAVFSARDPGVSPPLDVPAEGWRTLDAFAAWLAATRNDLEAPARALCPAIDEVLGAIGTLPGCRLARMSGSGATCFGLFEAPPVVSAWPETWWCALPSAADAL